ncbi:hypothetical protein GCM10007874_08990 [Labrys miyagiensis]|uniref:Chromosomal replication initiator DnaA C-terminal domain-containing protein n=1 Tax=Labrys miyagiensis TaxID=346912 RepID=A0ABQ6CBX6_9HYPH|nr:helix-turn-helix domain-containing protein [Labrys miyagiensis]GLS17883.1 hypothetical protein GCM10007874_08990 [Labrys miyagiensis]
MTSLSIRDPEIRLVSAREIRARRERLWGAQPPPPPLPANSMPPKSDAVALYRLVYAYEPPAMMLLLPGQPAKCGAAAEPAGPHGPSKRKFAALAKEVACIAAAHRVSLADIRGTGRAPAVRLARRAACYALVMRHPELSYGSIGVLLNKDHTTIYYAAHRHAVLTGLPPVARS